MMAKTKTPAPVPASRQLAVEGTPGKSREALLAGAATSAVFPAAMIVTDSSRNTLGELSLTDVVSALKESAKDVHGGDLAQVEAMLTGQAIALNSMFGELSRRAAVNMGQHLEAMNVYMKLALRAQGQCRATLETLAAIKNPPVVFAKQANIAHGPQQVNNHAAPSLAHAAQTPKPPTELLEHDHGQRLDTGTAGAASGSYQTVETVGKVYRPAQRRRKGQGQP
jgi:hypothetical protein